MDKTSVFFIILMCFLSLSLFSNEMNFHLLLDEEPEKHITAALSISEATDDYRSGSLLFMPIDGLSYLSSSFALEYAFNLSHKIAFKLPYFFLFNGHNETYHSAEIDVEYNYFKNLNGLYISFAAHIKNTAYISTNVLPESVYLYDIGKNTLGLSFGIMDKYSLSVAGRYRHYLGWAAAVQYDISLPMAHRQWRPGVIDIYGDLHYGAVFSEKTTIGISLGVGEYLALPYIGDGEKSDIYAVASLRLGVVYIIGHNAYLEFAGSLYPDVFLGSPPFNSMINCKTVFGYRF
jgi:hypothetical protein